MLKKVIAVVLIVLTAGIWFYLDRLNKQEQLIAEQTRQALIQARAEAAARAATRARFEAEIQQELDSCKSQADQAKQAFLLEKREPVRRKPGQFMVPDEAASEADAMQGKAYSACQLIHDTRFAQGY